MSYSLYSNWVIKCNKLPSSIHQLWSWEQCKYLYCKWLSMEISYLVTIFNSVWCVQHHFTTTVYVVRWGLWAATWHSSLNAAWAHLYRTSLFNCPKDRDVEVLLEYFKDYNSLWNLLLSIMNLIHFNIHGLWKRTLLGSPLKNLGILCTGKSYSFILFYSISIV